MEGQLCFVNCYILFFTRVAAVCKLWNCYLILWGSDKVTVQEIFL